MSADTQMTTDADDTEMVHRVLSDHQLLGWLYRLHPDADRIPQIDNDIQLWTALKGEQNNPEDMDYCDLHIRLLRLEKKCIMTEVTAQGASKHMSKVRLLSEMHSKTLDEISKVRTQIYHTEQADACIGHRLPKI